MAGNDEATVIGSYEATMAGNDEATGAGNMKESPSSPTATPHFSAQKR